MEPSTTGQSAKNSGLHDSHHINRDYGLTCMHIVNNQVRYLLNLSFLKNETLDNFKCSAAEAARKIVPPPR